MSKKAAFTKKREKLETSVVIDEPDPIPYFFTCPESSTIIEAFYDPDTETLKVSFVHDRSTYAYNKVAERIWKEFLEADSKGAFFSKRIRPIFDGKRVDEPTT